MAQRSCHRFILCLFCALLCGAFCCAHPAAPPKVPVFHAVPLVHFHMHADTEFTPLERGLIDQAIKDLEFQTAGYMRVELEYDLDFTDESVLRDEPLLIRMPEWAPLTISVDTHLGPGSKALGFTRTNKPQSFLVADRLGTPEMWRHVTMHELLHAAGLDDLPTTPTDIMARERTSVIPLCMSKVDAIEFCRANHCRFDRLNYCGT